MLGEERPYSPLVWVIQTLPSLPMLFLMERTLLRRQVQVSSSVARFARWWIPVKMFNKKKTQHIVGSHELVGSIFYDFNFGMFFDRRPMIPPVRFFSSTFLSGSSLCFLLIQDCCPIEKILNVR